LSEKSILVVSAHPDDVEFTAGGSLTRWSAEGWEINLAVCMDGGKGAYDPTIKPAGRRRSVIMNNSGQQRYWESRR
jgi:LmbE family N-acetylglucosaminyl deacetylase